MDALLLHKWPNKHVQSIGAVESGLGAVLDKYNFDRAKEDAPAADDDEVAKKEEELRRSERDERKQNADGARTDAALRRIDAIAVKFETAEDNGTLGPAFARWRSDLAGIEELYILNPNDAEERIANLRVMMMSLEEKTQDIEKLAAKLQQDHVTAIPPQVWKREEALGDDPEREPSHAETLINRLGFVFMAYRVDLWWWEVMERLHIFLMTAGLVFIYPDSPAQMATGAMISFAFLLANVIEKPYCTDDLNLLKGLSLFAQFITLFSGIMIAFIQSQDTVGEADQQLDYAIVSVMIVITNVSVVLLPILRPIIAGDVAAYKESALELLRKLPCWSSHSSSGFGFGKKGEKHGPPRWKLQLQDGHEQTGKLQITATIGFLRHKHLLSEDSSNHEPPFYPPFAVDTSVDDPVGNVNVPFFFYDADKFSKWLRMETEDHTHRDDAESNDFLHLCPHPRPDQV